MKLKNIVLSSFLFLLYSLSCSISVNASEILTEKTEMLDNYLIQTTYLKENDTSYKKIYSIQEEGIEIANYEFIYEKDDKIFFHTNFIEKKENDKNQPFYFYQILIYDKNNLPLSNIPISFYDENNIQKNIYSDEFGFVDLLTTSPYTISPLESSYNENFTERYNITLTNTKTEEKNNFYFLQYEYSLEPIQLNVKEEEFTRMEKDALITTYIKTETKVSEIIKTTIENISVDGIFIQKNTIIEQFDKNENLINKDIKTEYNEKKYEEITKNRLILSIIDKEKQFIENISVSINENLYKSEKSPIVIMTNEKPSIYFLDEKLNEIEYKLKEEKEVDTYFHKEYHLTYERNLQTIAKESTKKLENKKDRIIDKKQETATHILNNKETIPKESINISKKVNTKDNQQSILILILLLISCISANIFTYYKKNKK